MLLCITVHYTWIRNFNIDIVNIRQHIRVISADITSQCMKELNIGAASATEKGNLRIYKNADHWCNQ